MPRIAFQPEITFISKWSRIDIAHDKTAPLL